MKFDKSEFELVFGKYDLERHERFESGEGTFHVIAILTTGDRLEGIDIDLVQDDIVVLGKDISWRISQENVVAIGIKRREEHS